MVSTSTINQGDTLIVTLVLYDEDGDLTDADTNPTVEFWREGRLVLGPSAMSHTGLGRYRFRLNTSVLAVGAYSVVCRAQLSGWPLVETRTVEVIRPWEKSTSA